MTTPNHRAELAALRVIAMEDILNTPDVELRKEAVEDGEDIAAIAADLKSAMRDVAAAALRRRLSQAKARMTVLPVQRAGQLVRPPLERLKQLIQEAFASDPRLGLAFRDGKRQSDADWESLYDDLVALGKINPTSHED
ncbi:MAG: hypothetical protein M0P72_05415 [Metallibacterium scheffleri]|jgi:hypothetical protein|uniref:hypothetical protein n=1 Tax=Metallibacterium scheffleri TaxID=993689 RepID=UPI0026F1DC8D|nr:hypothetical protein [Metallibacterium scheffleri]MCK9366573.1 hypothetical protein [Metallibacterium scheffleri]